MGAAMRLSPASHLVLVLLALLAGWESLPGANAQSSCALGQQGSCNSCVCCCSKGGILTYKPKDDTACSCVPNYDDSFIGVVVLVGVTILVTAFSGYFFSGRGSLSPFPAMPPAPSASTSTSRLNTEGGRSPRRTTSSV